MLCVVGTRRKNVDLLMNLYGRKSSEIMLGRLMSVQMPISHVSE